LSLVGNLKIGTMSPLNLYKTFKGVLFLLSLAFGLLLFNLHCFVIFLLVRPWSLRYYRHLIRLGAAAWSNHSAWCFEQGQGVELVITGDTISDPEENALLIPNHQAMVDILLVFAFARRYNRAGHLKWFAKEAIKYIPIFGWALACTDSIYMKRSWQKDKNKVEQMFSRFHQEDIPLWLAIFPEGTRRTLRKQEISILFSQRQGVKPTSKVMYPRTKGFVATVGALRGHLKAVYNITFRYQDHPPSLTGLLSGSVDKIHLHVQRFDISSVPEDEKAMKQWLIERFLEKESYLNFATHSKEDS
jgi:1-acyl-sn-glycerol-3-phosphate acyltransferase